MFPYYWQLWPIGMACGFLAILAASSLPLSRGRWWAACVVVTLVGLCFYLPGVFFEAWTNKYGLLRDTVGAVLYAIAVPLATGGLVRRMAQSGVKPQVRVLWATGFTAVAIAGSIVFFLFVHCTSGDCL